jgi:L-threonylcarbamoyladenylate synthase
MKKPDLSNALFALENGEIIVYPTDTIYGLGADIFNKNAIDKLFKIKKRPKKEPFSVAVNNLKDIEKIAFTNNIAKKIINQFLPGALTIILEKKENVLDVLTGGSKKIAVRIPDNEIALEITRQFGPITSTSANIHKQNTPSVISDIIMLFKDQVSVYIDDGKISGLASTIIDLTSEEPEIIRQGSISKNQILDCIKNG